MMIVSKITIRVRSHDIFRKKNSKRKFHCSDDESLVIEMVISTATCIQVCVKLYMYHQMIYKDVVSHTKKLKNSQTKIQIHTHDAKFLHCAYSTRRSIIGT